LWDLLIYWLNNKNLFLYDGIIMSFMLVKLFLKSVGSMLINLYFFKSKWPFKKIVLIKLKLESQREWELILEKRELEIMIFRFKEFVNDYI
jgi:hypothetical protein